MRMFEGVWDCAPPYGRFSEAIRVVEDEDHPGSLDVAVMADGVHRMEERSLGLVRVAVAPDGSIYVLYEPSL